MNVAKARCVEVDCKRTRSMLAKFRGGQQNCELKVGDGAGALSSLRRLLRLGSCEILERGGRLVGLIPSADTCILVIGRGLSVCFVSYDFLLV